MQKNNFERNTCANQFDDKILEKMSFYSYKNGRKDNVIDGFQYFDKFEYKSGLYADVYYNDEYLVVTFRGSEDYGDFKADITMMRKHLPQQFYEADRLWNRLQEKDMFPNKKMTSTGHSLGGSVAVYLGNKYGDKAVAFCPYGIGDIVKPRENTDNITNYGNPNDPVFMHNYSWHIGRKKFVFNAKNFEDKYKYSHYNNFYEKVIDAQSRFHKLENYGNIDFATEDISGKEYLNNMQNFSNTNSCPGFVNVSSYTRNGKNVSGYTRNCPYHN